MVVGTDAVVNIVHLSPTISPRLIMLLRPDRLLNSKGVTLNGHHAHEDEHRNIPYNLLNTPRGHGFFSKQIPRREEHVAVPRALEDVSTEFGRTHHSTN